MSIKDSNAPKAPMARKMNKHRVIESDGLYRTFNNELYVCWRSDMGRDDRDQIIATYRLNGILCRRVGYDLFVREFDQERAGEIDQVLSCPTG